MREKFRYVTGVVSEEIKAERRVFRRTAFKVDVFQGGYAKMQAMVGNVQAMVGNVQAMV